MPLTIRQISTELGVQMSEIKALIDIIGIKPISECPTTHKQVFLQDTLLYSDKTPSYIIEYKNCMCGRVTKILKAYRQSKRNKK